MPEEKHFFGNVTLKALICHQGKYLFTFENDKNFEPTWDMPGGRMNKGETWRDGLKREAREEIGAEIEIGKPLITGNYFSRSGKPTFFVIYEAALVNPEASFSLLPGKVNETKWYSEEEALGLTFTYPEYKEALNTLFAAK